MEPHSPQARSLDWCVQGRSCFSPGFRTVGRVVLLLPEPRQTPFQLPHLCILERDPQGRASLWPGPWFPLGRTGQVVWGRGGCGGARSGSELRASQVPVTACPGAAATPG